MGFKKFAGGAITINKMLVIAGLCFAFILCTAFGASAFGIRQEGEAAPEYSSSEFQNSYSCHSWDGAPGQAENSFSGSASKFGIQPALLGAIFLQENGGSWKNNSWTSNDWPVSPAPANAAGPFQFVPGTWKGLIGKSEVKNKCSSPGEGDINKIDIASCVASYYIADKLKNSGITNDLDTIKEQDIKDVAVAYTSSFDYFNSWRKSGRDPSKLNSDYLRYHTNVWKYFQELNANCEKNSLEGNAKYTSLEQVQMYFGTTPEEIKKNTTDVSFMGKTITVNKVMVDDLKKVEASIKSSSYQITTISGYDDRQNVNDPSSKSAHAFGLAIDINPSTNPNTERSSSSAERDPAACKHDIPDNVAKAFENNNFFWGAKFKTICDPMHFQYGGNWQ